LFNTQPQAPDTPWGLQQLAKPLTSQDIQDLIDGKPLKSTKVQSATRAVPITDANKNVMNFDYSKVGQLKQIPTTPLAKTTANNTATSDATALSQIPQGYDKVTQQLGPQWFNKQQAAAAAGDWDTYYAIQQQVASIMKTPR